MDEIQFYLDRINEFEDERKINRELVIMMYQDGFSPKDIAYELYMSEDEVYNITSSADLARD